MAGSLRDQEDPNVADDEDEAVDVLSRSQSEADEYGDESYD